MKKIECLIDHAEVIPTLAQWFRLEWPVYYANRTVAEIEQDFRLDLNRHKLPIRLIAFQDEVLVGTIVLRERIFEGHTQSLTELGGLYVETPYRKRGIGTELIQAGMLKAKTLGLQTIYATTHIKSRIIEGLGWQRIGSVVSHGEQIPFYQCNFNHTLEIANTTDQTIE
jgi:N-acetylglutamate synthase-like GNAT family acetyltransferase